MRNADLYHDDVLTSPLDAGSCLHACSRKMNLQHHMYEDVTCDKYGTAEPKGALYFQYLTHKYADLFVVEPHR